MLLLFFLLEVENPELPKVEIEIPSQLKLKLEDDCYFIKRKKKASITLYNDYSYAVIVKQEVSITINIVIQDSQ